MRPWVVTGVVVAAVLSPLLDRRDSFPLSDYPMFAGHRPAVVELAHVVGVRADGTTAVLPPVALGTHEVVSAMEIARDASRSPDRAGELCAYVATRVGVDRFTAVSLRVDRYDTIRYFSEGRTPIATREVTRCAVGGP